MSLFPAASQDVQSLRHVAAQLGVLPEWLAAVISFETAGTWRPDIANPNSSARGLLQFTDATARGMGYASAAELVAKHPTVSGQLRGPVLRYFERLRPFPTLQSLALAVFYPVARTWPESRAFPSWVQRANPGIATVADYMRRVRARLSGLPGFSVDPLLWLAVGLLLVALIVVRRN